MAGLLRDKTRPSRIPPLPRAVIDRVVDLQAAINRFLAETNDDPRPFVWTADPDHIIERVH